MRNVRNMSRSIIILLLGFLCAGFPMLGPMRAISSASIANDAQWVAQRGMTKSIRESGVQFKSLPLRFELNAGQTDPQVRFIACSQSGDMFLTAREMVLRV